MRKSFTWFLSLMVLLTAFATHGVAQEYQETVEVYADGASQCYNEANNYAVTISVRDFIKISKFELDLKFNDAIFAYEGYDVEDAGAALSDGLTVGATGDVVTLEWADNAVTIGDDVKTEVITLYFSLLNFPGNIGTSYSTDLEWETTEFWYMTTSELDLVRTYKSFDGELTVNVLPGDIEVAFGAESCAGGNVTFTVTSPEAVSYLFNEGPNPEAWEGAWSNSPVYGGVQAGDVVRVRVKDANGCISLMQSFEVPETIEPVTFEVTTLNPTCYGEKGSVIFSVSGGTAPYKYLVWEYDTDSGTGVEHVFENFQFALKPAPAGSVYVVLVQDANGCVDEDDDDLWVPISIVDENDPFEVEVEDFNDVSCFGGSDGNIEVGIEGADGEYLFSIDGINWVAPDGDGGTVNFENLSAGTYTITAKNENGCKAVSEAIEIGEPDAITFEMNIVDTSCGGDNDGQIIVTDIEGGTAPYTLVIVEGGNETTETAVDGAFTFEGLKPAYYSLTIIDDNGCEVAYYNPNFSGNVISVQSPDDIRFVPVIEQPNCNNDDAIVTVTNITGSENYEVLFNGVQAEDGGNVFTWSYPYDNLEITVQNVVESGDDGALCPVSITLETSQIQNPSALTASIGDDILPPTCINGSDGNIELNISGGTKPYEYSLNNGPWQSTSNNLTFVKVRVGEGHTIDVRDANGCEFGDQLVFDVELEESVITASSAGVICFGTQTGEISVEFSSWADGLDDGGLPNRAVQYFVQYPDGHVSSFIPANGGVPTQFAAGKYEVWVTDLYTCESNRVEVTINENNELVIDNFEKLADAACFDKYEGKLLLQVMGGSGTVEYAIVNNESIDPQTITAERWGYFTSHNPVTDYRTVEFNVDKGTYYVWVRDNCGAYVSAGPIVVDGYDEFVVDDNLQYNDPLCYGSEDGSIVVPAGMVRGGSGNYTYTLLHCDSDDVVEGYENLTEGELTGLPAGCYDLIIADAEGCGEQLLWADLFDPEELGFDTEVEDISCFGAHDGVITIYVDGGTPGYFYAINSQNTWVPFEANEDEVKYIATEPGNYTIWIKDRNGCVTDPVTVTVREPEELGAEIEVTDAACYGDASGSISVEAFGGGFAGDDGTVNYYFIVDDLSGSWSSATTFGGLSVGDHTLYVGTDYTGTECTVAVPFTVGGPDPIVYDIEIEDVSCKDGSDGTFTVTILSGGTPFVDSVNPANSGYNVKLTGDSYDSGWQRTGSDFEYTFEGLAHSHYTVYIEDANGCGLPASIFQDEGPYTTIESWEVKEPDTYLTLNPEWINDVSCYGYEDGKFVLNAEGGTAPYKYYAGLSVPPAGGGHILVPDPESDEWVDSNEFEVGAGTWVTWVMDANGCIVGGEYENGIAVNKWRVKIEQPAEIVWDFVLKTTTPRVIDYKMPLCYGAWNGEIWIAAVSGGESPYNANVTGTSAAGEVVDLSFEDLYDLDLILGGIPASDQNGFEVTVTDANGCVTAAKVVHINQPAPVVVTVTAVDNSFSCAGAVEGLIQANVTGGGSSFMYQLLQDGEVLTGWQNIANKFIVRVGHTYTVQVRDENGCEGEGDIEILPVDDVVIISVDDRSCFEDAEPTAVISASAEEGRVMFVRYRTVVGSTNGDWSEWIEFNEGEGVGTHVFDTGLTYGDTNADDGHYDFQIRDDQGCESDIQFVTFVPVQNPIRIVDYAVDGTEIDVFDVVGGIKFDAYDYEYAVALEGSEGELVWQSSQVLTVEEPGSYIAYVRDAHHCVAETQPIEAGYVLYAIADVQDQEGESPVAGQVVVLEGTVTGIAEGEGFFMQDANAAWSGIWVAYEDAANLELGDGARVIGVVDEVNSVTTVLATSVEVIDAPVAVVPIDVTPSEAGEEQYESVLVKVTGARATGAGEDGLWELYYEAEDRATVGQWLYEYAPEAGGWYSVTGVVDARDDEFVMQPRIEEDIELADPETSAPGISKNDEFKVYPNPFKEQISIDNHDKLVRVIISNIAGQRVIDVKYPGKEIRTANLVSGVYVVSLFTENGLAKTERIVKR